MARLDFATPRSLDHLTVAIPSLGQLRSVRDCLTNLGASVVDFSVDDARAEARPIEQWLAELIGGQYQDVVFLTRQGVRLSCEYAGALGQRRRLVAALNQTRVIACGERPSKALAELGVGVAIQVPPCSENALLSTFEDLPLEGHVVGVQGLEPASGARIAECLARLGAHARLVGQSMTGDRTADELVDQLRLKPNPVIVFTTANQVRWIFDAALRGQREGALREGLGRARVIALESAAQLLADRGVAASLIPTRTLLALASEAEVIELFAPRSPRFDDAPRLSARFEPAANSNRNEAPLGGGQSQQRVVVVGNGMVGLRFCERMREYDTARRFSLTTFCEEPHPAYDRVQLSKYFSNPDADALLLQPLGWYEQNAVDLRLAQRVEAIDREQRLVLSSSGEKVPYDHLILATGSTPFVPPIAGLDKLGVFVYRTIEDLDAIIEYAQTVNTAAVIGGGLLGLEAAKAVYDLGLETHVIEFAPRLMPRQLDAAGAALLMRAISQLGVRVHTNKNTQRVLGSEAISGLQFADGDELPVELLIVSAGIRPRDDLARHAGLQLGPRGGIEVDDHLATSDPRVFAIGECALHRGLIHGLVAPGYEMADVVARRLCETVEASFEGADASAKLKLLGVDVASFGDPFAKGQSIIYEDLVKGIYKKLMLDDSGKRLLGGMLVGAADEYAQLTTLFRAGAELPPDPEALILGQRGEGFKLELSADAPVCSCNSLSKGQICEAIRAQELATLDAVKACTKAGTSCGGCVPLVTDLLSAELAAAGRAVKLTLCEHFQYTRQELYEIIKVKQLKTFREVVADCGSGSGCEVCKPTIASVLASVFNELIVEHDYLQDTNDRFLANVQRTGLYSIVPRVPGGEITPDKLIVLGQVAKEYGLYTKITGGQRIDLFGARLEQLPEIWEKLVAAGFESGHAYGKALRTVKSCVGSTWCRYGVGDSVGFAIRVEQRYKGIRAPHKLKGAVSGCVRECAEAQSKDFGLIATEQGYNLYVCGNGGARPRHAELLASDLDEETALRYLDRFLMYYIKTADKLTRTAVWVEKLEGGIEHVREVVVADSLGIAAELERAMQALVDSYRCEWAEVVKSPQKRKKFRHYINASHGDRTVELVKEREQTRPANWLKAAQYPKKRPVSLPVLRMSWVKLARVEDFPVDAGMNVKYGRNQIAIFNFSSRGEWYATQNMCPHMRDQVLSRGIIGDCKGEPKVACPMHKKTFSLRDGQCLTGGESPLATFSVKVEDGWVYVELPNQEATELLIGPGKRELEPQCEPRAAVVTV